MANGRREHVTRQTHDAGETIINLVQRLSTELHPRQPAAPSVTLDSLLDRELGFDSLGRVELIARI